MLRSETLGHNILNSSHPCHGAGGLEVFAARVTDNRGRDTFAVKMLESLNFYVLLKAKAPIYDPSTGIHLFDRLGNLVFAAGTRQLRHRLPDLKPGQELLVKFEITFNVQPGEYTFSLGASEPCEQGPNIGYIHDRHEMLGPIIVVADEAEIFPFYGIAQLPMRIKSFTAKSPSVDSRSTSDVFSNISEVSGPKSDESARFILAWEQATSA
jgi:hypothetical protein